MYTLAVLQRDTHFHPTRRFITTQVDLLIYKALTFISTTPLWAIEDVEVNPTHFRLALIVDICENERPD
jgi:hypothetical protein